MRIALQVLSALNVHGSVHLNNILIYIISNKIQRYTVYFIWKLHYMFRVVPLPIIRSANNCIYSIWYLSHRYCYLPLYVEELELRTPPTAHSNQFQLFHDSGR